MANEAEIGEKASPRDVFVHLLAIVVLYGSAVSFLVLVFNYINILFPDMLENSYSSVTEIYQSIRWSISTLVVLFPVYIGTTWYLNKSYFQNPSKRNLRIRKWLVYFTLFLTALIIIGDMVTLIYRLLEGYLTLRFILKILAVLFVAISVFIYYFWDLRKYGTE